MKPIKLLTLWFGELPVWYPKFLERMKANKCINWELVQLLCVEDVNRLAAMCSGVPCNKAGAYELCDLRPLFGQMFADKYAGYEWWGWCDLDIVVGDLDKALLPLLNEYDVISTASHIINGPLTLLRNNADVCSLYDIGPYAEILADPEYRNFDEAGFNEEAQIAKGIVNSNWSFTQAINESGLRVCYVGHSWNEKQEMISGTDVPSRCCELRDGKLIEVPTGRELLLYHFTSKIWPIPNRYLSYKVAQIEHLSSGNRRITNALPEESLEFWRDRIQDVLINKKPIHEVSYSTTIENWQKIQDHSSSVVKQHIEPHSKVLDAGCGYGAFLECFNNTELSVDYTAIDSSPDMIELAEAFYLGTGVRFVVADIRQLPFTDKQFDWCVCRGVEGSIKTLVGNGDWEIMEREMLRVSRKLILINLSCEYRILEG